jgi:hypothetical protein
MDFLDKYPNEFGNLFHVLDIWHKSVKLTKKLSKVIFTVTSLPYTIHCTIVSFRNIH